MTNKLEIEKKYYIKDYTIEKLSEIILNKGAKYLRTTKQKDIYFNVPGRDSLVSKECLRIRESDIKKEITYKPATDKLDMNNNFFAKEEINLLIKDVEIAKKLLLNIGCSIIVEVEKERKEFKLGKFKIFIDNIKHIGLFIEIEIIDILNNVEMSIQEIDKLINDFHINYVIESKPYRDIVMNKLN